MTKTMVEHFKKYKYWTLVGSDEASGKTFSPMRFLFYSEMNRSAWFFSLEHKSVIEVKKDLFGDLLPNLVPNCLQVV